MKKIFAEFDIIKLKQDKEAPGVFLKARKPAGWRAVDLSGLALYSMVLGRRTTLTFSAYLHLTSLVFYGAR